MKSSDKYYNNGQAVFSIENEVKTYFYKSGKLKAVGPFHDDQMNDEWNFYYETGELFQTAHFKSDVKHGKWIRYDKNGEIEYEEDFIDGKKVRTKDSQ